LGFIITEKLPLQGLWRRFPLISSVPSPSTNNNSSDDGGMGDESPHKTANR
jgi:hypothetical protein